MIEKISLSDDQESYAISIAENDVVVVLCLSGKIKIINKYDARDVLATLNPFETWTLSSSYAVVVKAVEANGADFLLVRYFRA